ncbi:MAG: copper chaperone PCu(A)C [Nocardioides sp.]
MKFVLALAASLVALSLTACGSDSNSAAAPDSTTAPMRSEAAVVSMADPWVKAVGSGEMSAAFGTLSNSGDAEVTLVSASTSVSDTVQLHETVMADGTMQMQQKDGGYTIPAGGSVELVPGGNHIMFMDVTADLEPGSEVTLTLTFDDGSSMDVEAVVKDYAGANENYEENPDMDGM